MIVDAFIFSDEIELLQIRLKYHNSNVDYFLIVESNTTFSGKKRDLIFENNKSLFKEFEQKIIYHIVDIPVELSIWEKEHFLRDSLRKYLLEICNDNDIICISDADELINFKSILNQKIDKPFLIELPTYYHFLNIKAHEIISVNLISPFSYIKDTNIGNRLTYSNFATAKLCCDVISTGYHLTYMFGGNLQKYVSKIESFSHSEYNNSYFKNIEKIEMSIKYFLDLFDRKYCKYQFVKIENNFDDDFIRIINTNNFIKWFCNDVKLIKIKSLNELPYLFNHYKSKIWFFRIKIAKNKAFIFLKRYLFEQY